MGNLLFLVASASAVDAELTAEGHGIGLNFNILDTNLINLVIIIGVLFYFGRKVVGKTLLDRRLQIETAIKSAETRQREAAAALKQQQQKLADAQAEADRIRQTAESNALVARDNILAKAAKDIERLKEEALSDLNSEQERAIAQLRQQVVAMALAKVESQLQGGVNDNTQQKLIDSSIALLGGRK